jgi:hypothetical protein
MVCAPDGVIVSLESPEGVIDTAAEKATEQFAEMAPVV